MPGLVTETGRDPTPNTRDVFKTKIGLPWSSPTEKNGVQALSFPPFMGKDRSTRDLGAPLFSRWSPIGSPQVRLLGLAVQAFSGPYRLPGGVWCHNRNRPLALSEATPSIMPLCPDLPHGSLSSPQSPLTTAPPHLLPH